MNIYTSYFAKISKLPKDIVPVSIAAIRPKGYYCLELKILAPSWSILNKYHEDHDEESYCFSYGQILKKLEASKIVSYLSKLTDGKDVALICYEKPEKFCHRHLVAEWLNRNGYKCVEWNEDYGHN